VLRNAKYRGNLQKGFNIMDIWSVENGQRTEHWDAVQPIHTLVYAPAVFVKWRQIQK
jgi:predicted SnoaL-like aldol condensation-catalyzing enzyme